MTFLAGNSDVEASIKSELETCLQDIIRWMTENKLKMNSTKTEIIVYGSKQQLAKNGLDHLSVGGVDVACVDSVRDLGIWMNISHKVLIYITQKCQIARHQLHNFAGIRNHLSQKSTEVIIHGLVHSHLQQPLCWSAKLSN